MKFEERMVGPKKWGKGKREKADKKPPKKHSLSKLEENKLLSGSLLSTSPKLHQTSSSS
jgi:hypothetical protein